MQAKQTLGENGENEHNEASDVETLKHAGKVFKQEEA